MGKFIAQRTVKEMVHAGHCILGSTVTVLGLTFKEDCPDLRNSRVIDIIHELQDYGINVQVHDPLADPEEALHEYGVKPVPFDDLGPASGVVVAVAHREFRSLEVADLKRLMGEAPVLVDVKGIYDPDAVRSTGIRFWRL